MISGFKSMGITIDNEQREAMQKLYNEKLGQVI